MAEEVGHSLGKLYSRMDTSTFGPQVTLCSQTMGYTLGLMEDVSHAPAFITQKPLRQHSIQYLLQDLLSVPTCSKGKLMQEAAGTAEEGFVSSVSPKERKA